MGVGNSLQNIREQPFSIFDHPFLVTGWTKVSLKRREKIAEIITRENALLVEDDPYSGLRYRGSDILPIKTLAPDHVVYISTLSKIFAPGLSAPQRHGSLITWLHREEGHSCLFCISAYSFP